MKSKILLFLAATFVLGLLAATPVLAQEGEPEVYTGPPKISVIAPNPAAPGNGIYIEGIGFQLNESVAITFAPDTPFEKVVIENATTVQVMEGIIFAEAFQVPVCPRGDYTLKIVSTNNTLTATLTVAPQLTLNPASGRPGNVLSPGGNGFAANANITIFLDDISCGSGTTDANGVISKASFTVPESTAGAHTIKGTDNAGEPIGLEFNVLPVLAVEPASATVGGNVTVSGQGYTANAKVIFYWDNVRVENDVTTDAKGSFSYDAFTVPANAPRGSHSIKVQDTSSNVTTVAVTIGEKINLTPDSGAVSEKITVSGTGFPVKTALTVKYDDAQVATFNSDIFGAFSADIIIPGSIHGEHTVTVTEGSNSVSQPFIVESDPPAAPQLLTPAEATPARDGFTWTAVTDPSGVSYTLQLAGDANFANVVLVKEGLTGPQYKLDKSDAVTAGDYYWRVRAMDGAGNESNWSTARSTSIGSSFSGVLIAAIAGGVLVVAIAGFWLFRKMKAAAK